MSQNGSEDRANNPVLYRFIQLAYEYVKRVAGESIQGNRADVLNRLYRQRVESVLNSTRLASQEQLDFPQVREWFRDQRAKRVGDIIVGRIEDFRFGNDSPDIFEKNETNYISQFRSDQQLLNELGLDAYATYLPIHFFFNGNQFDKDWGIYISEAGIMRLAAVLGQTCRKRLGAVARDKDHLFVEMAYQVLLRHELQHFKIESFALNAELTLGRALYSPYLTNVYAETYSTDRCLEEALANATVLHSIVIDRLVHKKIYPPPDSGKGWRYAWQEVIEDEFFDKQPSGYRNYRLATGWPEENDPFRDETSGQEALYLGMSPAGGYYATLTFGRRRRAINYLCNQIITGEQYPQKADVPFFAFLPDNYFLGAENLVPIHVVRSLDDKETFIEIPSPKRRPWEAFLKRIGYSPAGSGKGNHVLWKGPSGFEDVSLIFDENGLDSTSFKLALEKIGITGADYNTFRNTGELPRSLVQRLPVVD